jgi:hypothetical protein
MGFAEEMRILEGTINALNSLADKEADRKMAEIQLTQLRDRLATQIEARTQLSDELSFDISRLDAIELLKLSQDSVLIIGAQQTATYPDPIYAAASRFRTGIAAELFRLGVMPSPELAKTMPEYCGQVVGDKHSQLLFLHAVNFLHMASILTYSAMMNGTIAPEGNQADAILDICSTMKKLKTEPQANALPLMFSTLNVMRDFNMFVSPNVLNYYSLSTATETDMHTISLNAAGTLDLCSAVLKAAVAKPVQYGLMAGSETHKYMESLAECAPFLKRGLVSNVQMKADGFNHGQLVAAQPTRWVD